MTVLSLVLIDAGVMLIALFLSFYVRFLSGWIPYYYPMPKAEDYLMLGLLVLPFWLTLNYLNKLYNKHVTHVGTEEYARILHSGAEATLVIVVISFLFRAQFARGWVMLSWFFITVLMFAARYTARKIRHRQYARGLNQRNALIIGGNKEADLIYQQIQKSPFLGLNIVGILSEDKKSVSDLPVWGKPTELGKVLEEHPDVQKVILVTSALGPGLTQELCRYVNSHGVSAYVSPSLINIITSRINIQPIAGMPLLSIEKTEFTGARLAAKRTLDIGLTLIGAAVLLPVLLLIALAIRLDSKGKALFKQERVGLGGVHFMVYKFRTMFEGAEELRWQLAKANEVDGKIFKIKSDPRVTPVGKFLRKYSLDEFPQVINVLRGEMSLVGPRPLWTKELAAAAQDSDYRLWQEQRERALPGITGLWQVSGRSDLPFEEMVKLDVYYIENWSPFLDLYVLAKTFRAVVAASGAY